MVEQVLRQAELQGCHRSAAVMHLSPMWLGRACNEEQNSCGHVKDVFFSILAPRALPKFLIQEH